jgi:hypothetical protein
MKPLSRRARFVALPSSVVVALVVVACSASSPDAPSADPGSAVGGSSALNLPDQEICGNGIDDNDNGEIDENCGCTATPTPGHAELPGSSCTGGSGSADAGGSGGGTSDAAPGCVPVGSSETSCDDGKDDDCDGTIDCDDADCLHPGACGCRQQELYCGDGKDDDCDGKTDCADEDCPTCVPGAKRFCDEPNYCNWGLQTCGPSGEWGACTEVPPPSGCEGPFGFPTGYDVDCCVSMGFCCQSYPNDMSIGNCSGVVVCN